MPLTITDILTVYAAEQIADRNIAYRTGPEDTYDNTAETELATSILSVVAEIGPMDHVEVLTVLKAKLEAVRDAQ